MASIEKRKGRNGKESYRVKIRIKGTESVTATFVTRTEAKKWITKTESAIRDGRHLKESVAKRHTFTELIDRYLAEVLPMKSHQMIANQQTQLVWFKKEIGEYPLSEVTPAIIAGCRDKLLTESRSAYIGGKALNPSSVGRYLAALSHVFKVAIDDWGWIEESPITKIKKPKPRETGRVRFLDDEERNRLLLACKNSGSPFLYLCIVLAISTGMRKAELMNLTWADVYLEQGFIILHKTKNGERRRVTLAGQALELLKEHAKNKSSDKELLFPRSPNSNKPIDLRSDFITATKKAVIENFRWHDLRHCTASYLAMNGASLAEIAEVLGHKSFTMVKRYAHLSHAHVSNVVASMNSKIFNC